MGFTIYDFGLMIYDMDLGIKELALKWKLKYMGDKSSQMFKLRP